MKKNEHSTRKNLLNAHFFLLFFRKTRTFGVVRLADIVKGGLHAKFVKGGGENVKSPFPKDEVSVRHRFDRLCQMSLKGEAVNYYRCMDNRRKHEIMLSELSKDELEKLETNDKYFFENEHFMVLNYDIEVKNELLAEALKGLTDRRRNIVLLSYFLDMSDADIAREMNIVRSTVNEHKKTSLKLLKKIMNEETLWDGNLPTD